MRWSGISVFACFFFLSGILSADDLNDGFVKLSEGKPEQAIALWSPLAKDGDKVAQASLGLLYQSGEGTDPNHELAIELFQKSARQGYPYAFTALGSSFHEGLGVEANKQTALFWFLLAAEHDPNAAFMAQALASEIPQDLVDLELKKALDCKARKYSECGF